MSNLLYNLAALQAGKSISPPIIDYDKSTKLLQVLDSGANVNLRRLVSAKTAKRD